MIVRLTTIETSSADGQRNAQRLEELADDAADERQRQEHQDRGQVEPMTAPLISLLARSTAASPVWPSARCRVMFSITTTVSSMISPMATARPPSDIRFSVSPVRCRKTKLMIRLKGMDSAAMSGRSQALEEHEQDEHAEHAADDDGVADVGDGRLDQQPLIVDRPDGHAGRGRLRGVGEHDVQLARDLQRVAPQAAKDGERHGVLAVGADRHRPVLVRDGHPAQVAQPDRLAVLAGDDPVFQLQRIGGLRVGQHLILEHLAIEPADGLEPVFLAQAVGDVGDREPGGHEGLRVHLDEDLANIAPLHRDVRDVGNAG